MTAEPELWFDDEVWFDEVDEPLDVDPLEVEPLDVDPLDEDESSLLEDVVPELEELSLELALAVVAVSDWPEPVCVK